jgi:hypothetical protein
LDRVSEALVHYHARGKRVSQSLKLACKRKRERGKSYQLYLVQALLSGGVLLLGFLNLGRSFLCTTRETPEESAQEGTSGLVGVCFLPLPDENKNNRTFSFASRLSDVRGVGLFFLIILG